MATLTAVPKPTGKAERRTHTTTDTLCLTLEQLQGWKSPPFQRPLRVNKKVSALAETIKGDGGVIPGVITLGVLGHERYLLDGQHRREAFYLSGCAEAFCDVRIHHFENMAEMGEEFVNLNSQLVRMRPDDVLRGLEGVSDGMQLLRKRCSFVGYDYIRRTDKAPVVSMSSALRVWFGSQPDVPSQAGASAQSRVLLFTQEEANTCANFLLCCDKAWGRDREYARLWGSMNMMLCAWLYRRMVLSAYSYKTERIGAEMFVKCLMALSTDQNYLSWLIGRNTGERDRSPAYARIKQLFQKRLEAETGKKYLLPAPSWSQSHIGGPRGYAKRQA